MRVCVFWKLRPKKINVMEVNTCTVICFHNVKVKSFKCSWSSEILLTADAKMLFFVCFIQSIILWTAWNHGFIGKTIDFIDKAFSHRKTYELVSVVSKRAAPKTLARKLPSWAGKLWKTRKIHFLDFFCQYEKYRKYVNNYKIFSVFLVFRVLYLSPSNICYFLI